MSNPAIPPPPRKGGQLSRAKSMTDEALTREAYRYRILLAGPSGSGKTTGLITLPGKKLVLDVDGRKESLIGFPDTEVIDFHDEDSASAKPWSDLVALKTELWTLARKPGDFPYQAIIMDGLSSMNRRAMNWALLLDNSYGLGGSPAQQHYNPQMHELSKFILGMLALPCHIALTCHMEMYEDQKAKEINWLPRMYGKTRNEIASWFNETFYCERKRGKSSGGKTPGIEYSWITKGTGRKEQFKSALNRLGAYWTDPVDITLPPDWDGKTSQGFSKLLDLRFGKSEAKPSDSAKSAKGGEPPKET